MGPLGKRRSGGPLWGGLVPIELLRSGSVEAGLTGLRSKADGTSTIGESLATQDEVKAAGGGGHFDRWKRKRGGKCFPLTYLL